MRRRSPLQDGLDFGLGTCLIALILLIIVVVVVSLAIWLFFFFTGYV